MLKSPRFWLSNRFWSIDLADLCQCEAQIVRPCRTFRRGDQRQRRRHQGGRTRQQELRRRHQQRGRIQQTQDEDERALHEEAAEGTIHRWRPEFFGLFDPLSFRKIYTVWGGNLFWSFCNKFSESSPSLPGWHDSCSTAQELSENILQYRWNKLPPHPVQQGDTSGCSLGFVDIKI